MLFKAEKEKEGEICAQKIYNKDGVGGMIISKQAVKILQKEMILKSLMEEMIMKEIILKKFI